LNTEGAPFAVPCSLFAGLLLAMGWHASEYPPGESKNSPQLVASAWSTDPACGRWENAAAESKQVSNFALGYRLSVIIAYCLLRIIASCAMRDARARFARAHCLMSAVLLLLLLPASRLQELGSFVVLCQSLCSHGQ
jgi:hypothetical protein